MAGLRLDELLHGVQERLADIVMMQDRMHGLLDAVLAVASGLELDATLRRITQAAVDLVDAGYGGLGVLAVGQTLYVTEGKGRDQARGGDVEPIRAGDVIYTPADQWHWHGAAPDRLMTHLSITEAVPGDERPV
jgi:hypothetical protein